jgi:hypothetical protein
MEEKKPRSGSVTKIKAALGNEFMTHADLRHAHPELADGQISMAISYLKRSGIIEQQKTDRVNPYGRKQINTYRLKS